jgi:hypothetical protein
MIVSNKVYPVALKPFLRRICGDVRDFEYGLENKTLIGGKFAFEQIQFTKQEVSCQLN